MRDDRDRVVEIGELRSIFASKTLRRILQERKNYHQKKVNEYIRAEDWIKASVALGKFDDLDKFLNIIGLRLDKLTQEAKK